jgi:hypothetical protein
MMEKLVEWMILAGETEVLGEILAWRHFVHHKSHLPDPGMKSGHRSGKPATNHFSYGVAARGLLVRGIKNGRCIPVEYTYLPLYCHCTVDQEFEPNSLFVTLHMLLAKSRVNVCTWDTIVFSGWECWGRLLELMRQMMLHCVLSEM